MNINPAVITFFMQVKDILDKILNTAQKAFIDAQLHLSFQNYIQSERGKIALGLFLDDWHDSIQENKPKQ
jgi:hypothetical protein